MKFNNYNSEEVFQEFLKIAEKDGILEKEASYTLSDESVFSETVGKEIDISKELEKLAAEGREKLYDLGAEDLLGKAHPGGSKSLEGIDAGELAVVEDLDGQQKKMLDLVNKKAQVAKIATSVVKIASELDDNGYADFAKSLDKLAENLLTSLGNDAQNEMLLELDDEIGAENSMDFSEEEAAKVYEEAEAAKDHNSQMMLKVQKKINKLLNQLGYDPVKYEVPENGNMADSETRERIHEIFGLRPGVDYSDWQTLLRKLDESAHAKVFAPGHSPLDDLDLGHLYNK